MEPALEVHLMLIGGPVGQISDDANHTHDPPHRKQISTQMTCEHSYIEYSRLTVTSFDRLTRIIHTGKQDLGVLL
jgi:hypothetical protein